MGGGGGGGGASYQKVSYQALPFVWEFETVSTLSFMTLHTVPRRLFFPLSLDIRCSMLTLFFIYLFKDCQVI
jgi:hypothetical protein